MGYLDSVSLFPQNVDLLFWGGEVHRWKNTNISNLHKKIQLCQSLPESLTVYWSSLVIVISCVPDGSVELLLHCSFTSGACALLHLVNAHTSSPLQCLRNAGSQQAYSRGFRQLLTYPRQMAYGWTATNHWSKLQEKGRMSSSTKADSVLFVWKGSQQKMKVNTRVTMMRRSLRWRAWSGRGPWLKCCKRSRPSKL